MRKQKNPTRKPQNSCALELIPLSHLIIILLLLLYISQQDESVRALLYGVLNRLLS